MSTREQIADFLRQRRLAVVGVSRETGAFPNVVFRQLRDRGYDVVPVNPHAAELEGSQAFARVQEVTPPVEGVLVYVPAEAAQAVAEDCAAAGVKRVWFAGPAKAGAKLAPALDYCRAQGLEAVGGWCPYLFLPEAAFPHRLHSFLARLFGALPK